MVAAGVVGSGIVGVLIDKYRIYRSLFIIGAIGGGATLVLFYFGLPCSHVWLLVSAGCIGFFLVSLLPLSFEMSVEITYPVNESTSGGLMILFGNVVALILIVFFSFFDPLDVMLGVICYFGAMLLLLFFFKPEYKRLNFEIANAKHKETLNLQ